MGENGATGWLRLSPTGWLRRRTARRGYEAEVRGYVAAKTKWHAEARRLDDALRVAKAKGVKPSPKSRARLRPGERLQLELVGVELLETRSRPAQTTSRHAEVTIRAPIGIGVGVDRTDGSAPTDDSVVLDVGRVIVTDQRVAFAGQKHAREWRFDELISVECPPTRDTVYLPVTTRRETSGIRFRTEHHWRVTSRLEIGLALHCGDWRVIDGWRKRRAQLDAVAPSPPSAPAGVRVDLAARQRAYQSRQAQQARGRERERERGASRGQREQRRSAVSRSVPSPAGRGRGLLARRVIARLVDFVGAGLLFGYLANLFPDSLTGVAWATGITLFFYEARPVRRRGRSLGKRVVGLIVVEAGTRREPGWWRCLARTAVLGALVVTGVGALFELYRLSTGRTDCPIHDRIAGTDVVAA